MLSDVDFLSVFPWMTEPDSGPARDGRAGQPTRACLARWEDDGGRPAAPDPSRVVGLRRDPQAEPAPMPLVPVTALALCGVALARIGEQDAARAAGDPFLYYRRMPLDGPGGRISPPGGGPPAADPASPGRATS